MRIKLDALATNRNGKIKPSSRLQNSFERRHESKTSMRIDRIAISAQAEMLRYVQA